MIKKKIKKDNVINFPSKLSSIEKEIEGVVFAAAEPLDIETIQDKISKKADVQKISSRLPPDDEFQIRRFPGHAKTSFWQRSVAH